MRTENGCPQSVEIGGGSFLAWRNPLGEPDQLTPDSEVSAVTSSPVLSPDHLDLLATAAVTYRVLAAPPAAQMAGVSAAHAGRILRQQNLAAATLRGAASVATIDAYEFRPVMEPLDPVEVLKACHCYEDTCREAPGWESSIAHQLIQTILRAATQRLPGYSMAPWRWRRSSRCAEPVGFAAGWRPEVPRLEWVDAATLASRWESARLVVVTTEAVPDLPPGLPRRPSVIGLHDASDLSGLQELWTELVTDVMVWPLCRSALEIAVREPGEMLL